jgi:TM2 domain-containing membrane protein YozV
MSESSMSPEALPPPPLPPPSTAAAPPKGAKNPWVAVVLSVLLPGVGQVYNGQLAKAFVFFLGFAGAIYCTAEVNPFFGFLIPFVYLFNLVDAYRSAALGSSQPDAFDDAAESPAWGVTLVLLGGLLLLSNLGWLDLHRLARFWPVILIALGLVFLRGAMERRKAPRGPE